MRTETIIKKIYTFDELPEETQQRVLANLYSINVDHEWWENVYEDANQISMRIESFDIDRGSYCNAIFINSACETAYKIVDNHGVVCETHKTATAFLKERDEAVDCAPKDENGDFENEFELDQKLDKIETEFFKAIREDYRINLQKEYEYQTSEESIKDTIEANEYEFDEEGNLA